MKRKDTHPCGSFSAWGTGFKYEYDAPRRILDVLHAETGSPLVQMEFDKQLSRDPQYFVTMLDKSCQVRALTLTNNTSIDLSSAFDDDKLTPVLVETARLARFSFDLMQENFDRFERYFCEYNTLRHMQVRRVRKFEAGSAFFSAHLETSHSNKLMVESPTLHGVMSKLSQKIVQDLITREFVSHFDNVAHSLLRASSNVSILSLILNEKFSPSIRLREIGSEASKDSQSNN